MSPRVGRRRQQRRDAHERWNARARDDTTRRVWGLRDKLRRVRAVSRRKPPGRRSCSVGQRRPQGASSASAPGDLLVVLLRSPDPRSSSSSPSREPRSSLFTLLFFFRSLFLPGEILFLRLLPAPFSSSSRLSPTSASACASSGSRSRRAPTRACFMNAAERHLRFSSEYTLRYLSRPATATEWFGAVRSAGPDGAAASPCTLAKSLRARRRVDRVEWPAPRCPRRRTRRRGNTPARPMVVSPTSRSITARLSARTSARSESMFARADEELFVGLVRERRWRRPTEARGSPASSRAGAWPYTPSAGSRHRIF